MLIFASVKNNEPNYDDFSNENSGNAYGSIYGDTPKHEAAGNAYSRNFLARGYG